MELEKETRDKIQTYPVTIKARISQRQADTLEEVKAGTGMNDSEIIRQALKQWLSETLYKIKTNK
jgi:Arc/MetJ-type ribon-helix-helix transcriptional regulator